MSKSQEIEKFGLDNYDDFLCLRPPRLLIASLIFLCRALVIFVLIRASRGVPAGLDDLGDTETLSIASSLAAAPALLVLIALGARTPSAPAVARWIWTRGRALVALSALAYIALAVARLVSDPRGWMSGTSLAAKALVLVELAILGYVLLSSRVRQTFRDFPTA